MFEKTRSTSSCGKPPLDAQAALRPGAETKQTRLRDIFLTIDLPPTLGCMQFKTGTSFRDFHEADNLIVACSDPRFRSALNKFEESLGGEMDRIIAPGGPLIYCAGNYGLVDAKEAAMGWTELLANHHKVKTVYLISHAGCAAYGAALQRAGKDEEHMRACQTSDLGLVGRELSKMLPGVKIRKFVAEIAGGQVVFIEQE